MSKLRDRLKASDFDNLLDESNVEIKESGKVVSIPKHSIYSVEQVRTKFDEVKLKELAASLEINGQELPIIVNKLDSKGYCIQKGERRWRAAMLSDKVTHLDCVIRDKETSNIFGQLIENIQREDLSAIELATSFQRAKDDHNLNNRQLAERLGKTDAYVSKYLQVLKAPNYILEAYDAGLVGDVETINELRKVALVDDTQARSLVEVGEYISRDTAISLKDSIHKELVKREVSLQKEVNRNKTAKKPNYKVTDIKIEYDGRTGYLCTSAPDKETLTAYFEDSEQFEQAAPEQVRLIGYR